MIGVAVCFEGIRAHLPVEYSKNFENDTISKYLGPVNDPHYDYVCLYEAPDPNPDPRAATQAI